MLNVTCCRFINMTTNNHHIQNSCLKSLGLFLEINLLTTYLSPDFGHMLSVGAIHFEAKFYASKKEWDKVR